jgi:predicted RNase H-like HicB family nuclease
MSLTFKLEKDGKKWHAFCPELAGCHTFGTTKEEALKHLKDAVMLYVEDEIDNQSMKAVITVIELNKKATNV